MPSREEIIAALTAAGPFELIDDESRGHPIRVYRRAPASFRQVFEGTRGHGERLFSIYEDDSYRVAREALCEAHADDHSTARAFARDMDVGCALAAAIRTMPLPGDWQPTHLHIKSGNEYRVIAIGLIEATLHPCVVYDDKKGNVWIRPKPEFDDGRFMPLSLEGPAP